MEGLAKPVPKRSEGMEALLRWNPEKPDFCEAKSHPKNKNSKLDICPDILSFFILSCKKLKKVIFFLLILLMGRLLIVFLWEKTMADTMHALEKNPNWKGRRDSVVMGADGERFDFFLYFCYTFDRFYV